MIEIKDMIRNEMQAGRFTVFTSPGDVTGNLFDMIAKGKFNGDFVITGCPTVKGKPIWSCMDDLIANPHSHGLIEAIGAISQIVKAINTYLVFSDRSIPELKIRFEANIKDVFEHDSSRHNPTVWIHLGHGMLEHDFEPIDELEDWEDEVLEPVPGISNGHEKEDFISARWLRDAIIKMDGDILFMALPICWGKQISEVLNESKSILCSHAPYRFSVSETLEFYDCDENGILPTHTLTTWSEWVRVFEKELRYAIVNHSTEIYENNERNSGKQNGR